MSMNLALKKSEELNFTPYQTPSHISYAAMQSEDTTSFYKEWAMSLTGEGCEEGPNENFLKIDKLLAEGWHWVIV